mgnify:CR=1 FL=1
MIPWLLLLSYFAVVYACLWKLFVKAGRKAWEGFVRDCFTEFARILRPGAVAASAATAESRAPPSTPGGLLLLFCEQPKAAKHTPSTAVSFTEPVYSSAEPTAPLRR